VAPGLALAQGDVMAAIRVTAQHIEQGERNNPMACPIALAIIEQQWPTAEVDVFDGHAYACDCLGIVIKDHLVAAMPAEADEFISAFDAGDEVEPFEFELAWMDPDGVEVTP
jgi:hypothetical protein